MLCVIIASVNLDAMAEPFRSILYFGAFGYTYASYPAEWLFRQSLRLWPPVYVLYFLFMYKLSPGLMRHSDSPSSTWKRLVDNLVFRTFVALCAGLGYPLAFVAIPTISAYVLITVIVAIASALAVVPFWAYQTYHVFGAIFHADGSRLWLLAAPYSVTTLACVVLLLMARGLVPIIARKISLGGR